MTNLSSFLDDAPCGLLVLNEEGDIVEANARLRSWLGVTHDGMAKLPAVGIFTKASQVVFETTIVPLLALGQEVEGASLDLRAADGEAIPVLLSAETVSDGARVLTRLALLRASARRNLEREMADARAQAEARLEINKREGELREQFVAILGHDLRNPLASMSSAIRILSKEPLSEKGAQISDMAQASVHRMSRLIDNILEFARNRLGGGIDLDMSDGARLNEQVRLVVDELRAAHPEAQIDLSISLPVTPPCDVWRIGQMLSNLLGNAITHGAEGHPVEVRVMATDGGELQIDVVNKGEPIAEAELPQLFDPFVSTSESQRAGLGLGLYIAREIAHLHGGTLNVISGEAETTFTFRMRCEAAG